MQACRGRPFRVGFGDREAAPLEAAAALTAVAAELEEVEHLLVQGARGREIGDAESDVVDRAHLLASCGCSVCVFVAGPRIVTSG